MLTFKQHLLEIIKPPIYIDLGSLVLKYIPEEVISFVKKEKRTMKITRFILNSSLYIIFKPNVDENKIYQLIKILDRHKVNYSYSFPYEDI